MTRHLLRLVWNRRRSNIPIAVEILLSFVVLSAVTTMIVFFVANYREPLGFEVDNIWTVTMDKRAMSNKAGGTANATTGDAPGSDAQTDRGWVEQRARVAALMDSIRGLPDVATVAAGAITPYSASSTEETIGHGGRRLQFGANAATDEFAEALGLEITKGRWFSREDDGAQWRPVVVNEHLAREAFPGQDPVGKLLGDGASGGSAGSPTERMRVVGVIRAFRKDGEYAAPGNYLFERIRLDDPNPDVRPPRELIIRVRPGTSAAFEEAAVSRLRASEPAWTFKAEPLPQARETALRFWMAPLTVALVVASFLMLMVALGLTGVLWLHITQRAREIGLRRAKGATVGHIRRQFVGEVVLLTAIASTVGLAIVVQFPVLQIIEAVSPVIYAIGTTIALAVIFTLVIACAWFPARVASDVEPAEALRYE